MTFYSTGVIIDARLFRQAPNRDGFASKLPYQIHQIQAEISATTDDITAVFSYVDTYLVERVSTFKRTSLVYCECCELQCMRSPSLTRRSAPAQLSLFAIPHIKINIEVKGHIQSFSMLTWSGKRLFWCQVMLNFGRVVTISKSAMFRWVGFWSLWQSIKVCSLLKTEWPANVLFEHSLATTSQSCVKYRRGRFRHSSPFTS
jgi:hypothetical protein